MNMVAEERPFRAKLRRLKMWARVVGVLLALAVAYLAHRAMAPCIAKMDAAMARGSWNGK